MQKRKTNRMEKVDEEFKREIGKIIVNGWVNHGPWAPRR